MQRSRGRGRVYRQIIPVLAGTIRHWGAARTDSRYFGFLELFETVVGQSGRRAKKNPAVPPSKLQFHPVRANFDVSKNLPGAVEVKSTVAFNLGIDVDQNESTGVGRRRELGNRLQ